MMRRPASVLFCAVLSLALGGCADPSVSASESTVPQQTDPTLDDQVAPETLTGYRALAEGINGFFVKAQRVEEQHPDADPKDADEITALVNYKFPKGVELVEYSNTDQGMCFLGPADTHVVLTEVGDDLRQMFGTGACQYEDGDIVVDIGIDFAAAVKQDETSVVYSAKVVKGADLAARIPGLNDFLDVLNESL